MHMGMQPLHIEQWVQQRQCLARTGYLETQIALLKGMRIAPDSRAGGGAPEMGSRLSTLATCGFGVRTSLEATTG